MPLTSMTFQLGWNDARKDLFIVLVQIAKEIGVDSPTKDEVDDILDEIDENGDNRISK